MDWVALSLLQAGRLRDRGGDNFAKQHESLQYLDTIATAWRI